MMTVNIGTKSNCASVESVIRLVLWTGFLKMFHHSFKKFPQFLDEAETSSPVMMK